MAAKPKKSKKCKACAEPKKYTQHTCGLKSLQDLLRF